jgi:hypothetical protein
MNRRTPKVQKADGLGTGVCSLGRALFWAPSSKWGQSGIIDSNVARTMRRKP